MKYLKTKQLKITLLAIFALAVLTAGALWYLNKGDVRGARAGWYNDNWSYRKQIVINSDYVTGDLTDFPVLISFTDTQVASHTQATGGDIIFIDSNGQKLSHEIESFATSSTGAFVGWVKVPNLSSTDDTMINMYYGNTGVSDQQDVTNVWDDNYVMVQHMASTSPDTRYDSTKNNNNGVATNGASATSSGKIGDCMEFDGDNDFVELGSITSGHSLMLNNSDVTISAWFKQKGGGDQYQRIVDKSDGGDGQNGYALQVGPNGNYIALTVDQNIYRETDPSYATNTWVHLVGVIKSDDFELYINGTETVGSWSSGSATQPGGTTTNMRIGTWNHSTAREFDGELDEIRISKTARTVDWIQTSFTNQASTTLFLSVQDEEVGPGPVGYWSFDRGYGTTANDESGQGNDGTITGASWQDESMCVSGKCLYFDGGNNTKVDINSLDEKFNGENEFSISGWFKSAELIGTIISNSYNTQPPGPWQYGWMLSLYPTDILSFITGDGGNIDQSSSLVDVNDNKWHFFAINWDKSNAEVYLDGNLKIIDSQSIATLNLQQFYIGNMNQYDGVGGYPFTGYIDEIKAYPYTRSADEIKQDYAAGLAGIKSNSGVAASFGSQSDSWMSDGLVGYWKMDEPSTDSSYADSSGNSNTGTASGNASTTAGKFGNGGVFDGTGDYIEITHSSKLAFSTSSSFSLSSWIYVPSLPGSWKSVITKSRDASPWYGVWIDNSNKWIFGGLTNVAGPSVSTGWTHITLVQNGNNGNRIIYVNSASAGTGSAQSGNGSGNLVIAADNTYPAENFNGKIDEVRIYNRALSPREVRQLYEWAPGPVAHWKFDEKTGDTAYDSVASSSFAGGNDGQLGNSSDSDTRDPVWSHRGKYGGALLFDGCSGCGQDDYVDAGNKEILNNMNSFTLSAWIFQQSGGFEGGGQTFVDKDSGNGNGWAFYSAADGYFAFGMNYGSSNLLQRSASGAVEFNKWQHVAVTYFATTSQNAYYENVHLYINGVEAPYNIQSNGTGGKDDDSANIIKIGDGNGFDTFDGYIDDVRIYNYARTQKQILEDMNGGRPAINQPVLDLRFEQGYGGTAYDYSGQGNDGTLFHGGTGDNDATSSMWDLNGKFGKAMEFDGTDDYVDLGNISSLESDNFTISLWANRQDFTSHDVLAAIQHQGGTGKSGVWIWLASNDLIRFGITYPNNAQDIITSERTITDSNWHHYLFIKDGTTGKVYFDNILDFSGTFGDSTMDWTGTNKKTVIGGEVSDSSIINHFNGLIDEVKIYNYALSEDEVKTLYNSGVSTVMGAIPDYTTATTGAAAAYCVPGSTDYCGAPILELKMDEKTGNTTYDTSGNGNDGQLGLLATKSSSSPAWSRGKYGSALDLDGSNDHIEVNDDSILTLDPNKDYTWEAWVNPRDLDAAFTGNLWWHGQDNSNTFWLYTTSYSGHGTFGDLTRGVHVSWMNTTWCSSEESNDNVVSENEWNHIEVTYDASEAAGDRFTIFVNGRDESNGTDYSDCAPSSINPVDIWLGGNARYPAEYLDGYMDSIKLYEYERTPAQIAWDYNRGKPIAHWKFDECSGSTILDWAPGADGNAANANPGQLFLGTGGVTATGTCASSSDSFWYNGKDGKRNSAGSFDGVDNGVKLPIDIFDNYSEGAVSLWFKPEDNGDSWQILFAPDDSTAGYQTFEIAYQPDENNIAVWNFSDGTYLEGYGISNPTNWHHLLYLVDSLGSYLFIDGEAHDTSGNNNFFSQVEGGATTYYAIGCLNQDGGGCATSEMFNGLIDEVKVWAYPLSAEQVKTEYSGGAVRFGN